jgi:hypothetical protein
MNINILLIIEGMEYFINYLKKLEVVMLKNKKVQIIMIILLFCCTALAAAQTIPVKVTVAIDCTNTNSCRYEVFSIDVPSDYKLTDYALKAKIEAQCGSLYVNFHNWNINWINRNECSVRVKATLVF